ncbi:MAG: nucleotidyltransferase [Elusimicrobia bacterium]|nr:nucleotidyltransferase [Elusimicrobiota bacterium]
MGAQSGGPQPRAPQLEDLLSLCRALNEAGARYVLVGGFAVILHGYARGTMDVDLLIDPSPFNVRKVKSALASLPDNAAAQVDDTDVERYTVVRVADEIVVDLIAKAGGVPFDEVIAGALRREIDGVEIPYAGLRELIRTKDTPRPKDKNDVLFLRRRLEETP